MKKLERESPRGAGQNGPCDIVLDDDLGLWSCEQQVIHVGLKPDGTPMDMTIFGLDMTLMDTAYSLWAASQRIVEVYTDNLSRIPELSEFELGVPSFDFYAWGVPKYVPLSQAWETFAEILAGIEAARPSGLLPGVAEWLKTLALQSHLIIVTNNKTPSLPEIIRVQAGVDVDLVVVDDDVAPVLGVLNNSYRALHEYGCKLFYFDNSLREIQAADACGPPLYPVAVACNKIHAPSNAGQKAAWKRLAIQSGARGILSPGQICAAISGGYDLNGSLSSW
jgi:phosphoglycolate phosphatase-like HAD superfamily hydrolase